MPSPHLVRLELRQHASHLRHLQHAALGARLQVRQLRIERRVLRHQPRVLVPRRSELRLCGVAAIAAAVAAAAPADTVPKLTTQLWSRSSRSCRPHRADIQERLLATSGACTHAGEGQRHGATAVNRRDARQLPCAQPVCRPLRPASFLPHTRRKGWHRGHNRWICGDTTIVSLNAPASGGAGILGPG